MRKEKPGNCQCYRANRVIGYLLPQKVSKTPHWERGYRTHGLWIENKRIAAIGLGLRGLWDGIYRWWLDEDPNSVGFREAKTLRAAKRAVEKALKEKALEHGRVRKQNQRHRLLPPSSGH